MDRTKTRRCEVHWSIYIYIYQHIDRYIGLYKSIHWSIHFLLFFFQKSIYRSLVRRHFIGNQSIFLKRVHRCSPPLDSATTMATSAKWEMVLGGPTRYSGALILPPSDGNTKHELGSRKQRFSLTTSFLRSALRAPPGGLPERARRHEAGYQTKCWQIERRKVASTSLFHCAMKHVSEYVLAKRINTALKRSRGQTRSKRLQSSPMHPYPSLPDARTL